MLKQGVHIVTTVPRRRPKRSTRDSLIPLFALFREPIMHKKFPAWSEAVKLSVAVVTDNFR
jgi:hypothetical protein